MDWTARYEELRRLAWQEQPLIGGGPALTLFLRQGLVAWIDAWSQQTAAGEEDAKPIGAVDATTVCLPYELRASFVGLLAEIVLHHRPEVSP